MMAGTPQRVAGQRPQPRRDRCSMLPSSRSKTLSHWFCLVAIVFVFAETSAFLQPRSLRRRQRHLMPMSKVLDTEEGEGPVWDPVNQIYIGGVVPEHAEVDKMIEESGGVLRLFGYGSLCWNPGTGALAHPSVKHTLGRARGYRRCWAQKSTDHRGNPGFPGLVCTLLRDEEFRRFRRPESEEESLTEGLLYEIPPQLVDKCLEELDFREKGVRSICLEDMARVRTVGWHSPFRPSRSGRGTREMLSTSSRTSLRRQSRLSCTVEHLTIRLFGLVLYEIFRLLLVS